MSDINYDNGANAVNSVKNLKRVYGDMVNNQINDETKLLDRLDTPNIRSQRNGGDGYWISCQFAGNMSATFTDGIFPDPDSTKKEQGVVRLTRVYSTASIDGLYDFESDSEKKAFAVGLKDEIKGATQGIAREVNRACYGDKTGVYPGKVSSTSDGLTLVWSEYRPFVANWFQKGLILEVGTVTGTGAAATWTTTATKPIVKIVAVNKVTKTLTVAVVQAGTVDIAANDRFRIYKTTTSLTGLGAILSANPSIQDIDSTVWPDWNPVILGNSGTPRTATMDLVRQLGQTIEDESGHSASNRQFVLTTNGLVRTLANEATTLLNYTVGFGEDKPLHANRSNVVKIGPWDIVGDRSAAKGELALIDPEYIQLYSNSADWQFVEQGGSNLMQLSYQDQRNIVLKRYLQLAVTQLNAHGKLTDLTDTSVH